MNRLQKQYFKTNCIPWHFVKEHWVTWDLGGCFSCIFIDCDVYFPCLGSRLRAFPNKNSFIQPSWKHSWSDDSTWPCDVNERRLNKMYLHMKYYCELYPWNTHSLWRWNGTHKWIYFLIRKYGRCSFRYNAMVSLRKIKPWRMSIRLRRNN